MVNRRTASDRVKRREKMLKWAKNMFRHVKPLF